MNPGSRRFLGYNLLMLGLGVAALLIIVLAAFVFSARAQRHADEALKAGRVDRLVLEYVSALVDAETAQRGYLLVRQESYLEPYKSALLDVEKYANAVREGVTSLASGAVPVEAVDKMLALGHRKMELVGHSVDGARAGPLSMDRLLAESEVGKSTMDAVRAASDQIRDILASVRQVEVARMQGAADTLTSLISLGVAMVVTLAIGAALFIAQHLRELVAMRNDLIEANKDLEARVQERTEHVMRANDELQRYAYIVGHDLRAPLVNIMGFVSELETATKTLIGHIETIGGRSGDAGAVAVLAAAEQDIPEALAFIRSSMMRMDGLINEILKLSRAGRKILEPEPIPTQALVDNCIAAIQQRFEEAGAKVSIEGKLPLIVSDRSAVEQIFSNLLDNAAKYVAPGRPGEIVVRGKLQGRSAVFEVQDNGRGVAPVDHERIFELFRRAGIHDRPGEGIGLAHTRALARRLGGDVTVVSDGVNGSIFKVVLARDLSIMLAGGQR